MIRGSAATGKAFAVIASRAVLLAAVALPATAAERSPPPVSPLLPNGLLLPDVVSLPHTVSASDLNWFEKLAHDVRLAPASAYRGGVIRFSRAPRAQWGHAAVIEIAEGAPGELVIRQLVAPGSYQKGWSTSTDLVERRGGNFELLSRAIIRRLTSEAELSRTMKDPASLVACANPDWIVVEVRSASHLPLFLRRQASCLKPDPLGDVEGLVNRMIAEARKSPPPAVR